MLHEVAANNLDITPIVNSIRRLLHRTNFFEWDMVNEVPIHKSLSLDRNGSYVP